MYISHTRHIIGHVLRIKPKIVKCASLIQSTLHIIKDDDSTELLHICPLALPQNKLFHQGLCKIIANVFRSFRILAKISIVTDDRVVIKQNMLLIKNCNNLISVLVCKGWFFCQTLFMKVLINWNNFYWEIWLFSFWVLQNKPWY